METYIREWFEIIENMKNSNTYKLAWGRSILDIAISGGYIIVNNQAVFQVSLIAEKMIKYYWDQTYYFNLKQGPINKQPVLLTHVQELIQYYKEKTGNINPIWYNKAEQTLKEDAIYFNKVISKAVKIINQDVAWRFPNANDFEIYKLEPEKILVKKLLITSLDNAKLLADYGVLLMQLINYKWVQLLELYNRSPRIASKISGFDRGQIDRKNLAKYKAILLRQFKNRDVIDFYTGKVLQENEISIDHVIPWSFMYSDDIWNLVITSKSSNSSKLNKIPSSEYIEKLKEQALALKNILQEEKNSYYNELEEAISNNYIDKFYLDSKQ